MLLKLRIIHKIVNLVCQNSLFLDSNISHIFILFVSCFIFVMHQFFCFLGIFYVFFIFCFFLRMCFFYKCFISSCRHHVELFVGLGPTSERRWKINYKGAFSHFFFLILGGKIFHSLLLLVGCWFFLFLLFFFEKGRGKRFFIFRLGIKEDNLDSGEDEDWGGGRR